MIVKYIRSHINKLFQEIGSPEFIAGGTAIGIFFGFLPIFGLKTLAAIVCSYITRRSTIASVIGVSLHDLFLPLWPFIIRYQFEIGFWLLSHPHRFPPPLIISKESINFFGTFSYDNLTETILELLLGGIICALPIAFTSYFVVLFIVRKKKKQSKI